MNEPRPDRIRTCLGGQAHHWLVPAGADYRVPGFETPMWTCLRCGERIHPRLMLADRRSVVASNWAAAARRGRAAARARLRAPEDD